MIIIYIIILIIVYDFTSLIYAIIKSHTVQKFDIKPKISEVDISHIPNNILLFFNQLDKDMDIISFKPIFYLKHISFDNIIIYIRYYDNINDSAVACVGEHIINKSIKYKYYIEYFAKNSKNYEIVTNNNLFIPIFKKKLKYKLKRYPKIRFSHDLYNKHKLHCSFYKIKLLNKNNSKINKSIKLKNIVTANINELNYQVKYGYLYIDHTNKVYRTTWKGSMIFTTKVYLSMLLRFKRINDSI